MPETYWFPLPCFAGRVYAFDKDAKRLARLQANARSAGAEHVIRATCGDFLSIDPTSAKYAQVSGCSQAVLSVQQVNPDAKGVRLLLVKCQNVGARWAWLTVAAATQG